MDRSPAEVDAILPRPHPAVMFREVSDGAVLLQMEDEIYFGLNEVGSRIWQLLPPSCATLEELCARLGETYPDVAADSSWWMSPSCWTSSASTSSWWTVREGVSVD